MVYLFTTVQLSHQVLCKKNSTNSLKCRKPLSDVQDTFDWWDGFVPNVVSGDDMHCFILLVIKVKSTFEPEWNLLLICAPTLILPCAPSLVFQI